MKKWNVSVWPDQGFLLVRRFLVLSHNLRNSFRRFSDDDDGGTEKNRTVPSADTRRRVSTTTFDGIDVERRRRRWRRRRRRRRRHSSRRSTVSIFLGVGPPSKNRLDRRSLLRPRFGGSELHARRLRKRARYEKKPRTNFPKWVVTFSRNGWRLVWKTEKIKKNFFHNNGLNACLSLRWQLLTVILAWKLRRCSSVSRASFKGPSLVQFYRGFESRRGIRWWGKF